MATITAVTVAGNLTRDPEIRYTREGQATTSLSVAVNRRWQNQQTKEWEESVSFLDVVCWRDLAENVALSLTKGPGCWSPVAWSSGVGRPMAGSAGPRSRSWPTTLLPPSGSPPSTCIGSTALWPTTTRAPRPPRSERLVIVRAGPVIRSRPMVTRSEQAPRK